MPSAAVPLLREEQALQQADLCQLSMQDQAGGNTAKRKLSAERGGDAATDDGHTPEQPRPMIRLPPVPVKRQRRPAQQDRSTHAALPLKRIRRVETE